MSSGTRKRVFAGAAVLLLGPAVLLAVREPASTPRAETRARRSTGVVAIQTRPAPAASSHPEPFRGTAPPSRSTHSGRETAGNEREANRAPAVAPREARAARAAARTFLNGYLPYSYGRSNVAAIRAATPTLMRALQQAPPRVPGTVARARPRLVWVHAEGATGDREVDVLAAVDDGQRRYEVPVKVRRARGRWVVMEISG